MRECQNELWLERPLINIYIYIYIYIYTHIYIYIYTHIYIYIYIHIHICVCIHKRIYTYDIICVYVLRCNEVIFRNQWNRY